MSYTGESCGQVTMEIIPEFASAEQAESADDAETINDVEGLKYLDLRFKIKSCSALPAKLAADVRFRLSFLFFFSDDCMHIDPLNSGAFGKLCNGSPGASSRFLTGSAIFCCLSTTSS